MYVGDCALIDGEFKIGFEWNWSENVDINIFAFLLGEDGKIISDKHLVFYNSNLRLRVEHPGTLNTLASPVEILPLEAFKEFSIESRPTDPELSVIGDIEYRKSPSSGHEDLESWDINLRRVHPKVQQIIFCAGIYQPASTGKTLADDLTYVRFYHPEQKVEEAAFLYIIEDDYTSSGAVEICNLNRCEEGWELLPVSIGHENVEKLISKYV